MMSYSKKQYENSLVNPTYAGCKLSFTPGLSSLLLVTSVRFPLFLWVRHHYIAWCWFVTRSHDVQVIPPWQLLVIQYLIVNIYLQPIWATKIDHFMGDLAFGVIYSTCPPQGGGLKRSNCPDSTSPKPPVKGVKILDSAENFVFNSPTLNHVVLHVFHVYIVCHEYIDTCIYLFVVHLDIILLVVSDGGDSRLEIMIFVWESRGN